MAEMLATDGAGVGVGADGDRLPWLEAVEDEDGKTGPSAGKLVGSLLIGLAAVALAIFAIFSLANRDGGTGAPEEISADSGEYKQPAPEAGGMKVEGEGDSAYAASEGSDPNGRINLDAIPEAPVAGARGVAPAEQLATKAAPAAPAGDARPAAAEPAAPPAPVAVSGGTSVQLGAFSSSAGAQSAWKSLSGRFASLAPLASAVVPANIGGKTLYRLRASVASPAEARILCAKLKVAGESCTIIG